MRRLISRALLIAALTGCAATRLSLSDRAVYVSAPIINMHEHIQSRAEVRKLLDAMDASGITYTLLLGSPIQTLTFKGGFANYDGNNAQVLAIQAAYPGRFSAFVTMDPRDPDKLAKLIGYLRSGAKGLKLYNGHSLFHDLPLNDRAMEPVFAYLEQHRIPLLWHVSLGKYGAEFEDVMKRHPQLIVILPHLGLSAAHLERLEAMLDRYPTLYTDLSFGYDPYLKEGLRRISHDPVTYRAFISRYRDRILFGTDIVVTDHPRKNAEWMTAVMGCYRRMLEVNRYRCVLVEEELNGLALDGKTLRAIYDVNPQRVLASVSGPGWLDGDGSSSSREKHAMVVIPSP